MKKEADCIYENVTINYIVVRICRRLSIHLVVAQ
jgi:hypothetical protein